MSSVSFSCTVKSILFGVNAVSVEVWNNAGYQNSIGYIDGSGETSTTPSVSPSSGSLYNYAFSSQPDTLMEEDTTSSLYIDVNPFYIPASDLTVGNYLVFVCQVITADITGAYTESDNLLIADFDNSTASATGDADALITGSFIGSYNSTAFNASALVGGIVIGDTSPDDYTPLTASSAYIAFGFPATGSLADVNVEIIIDGSNF